MNISELFIRRPVTTTLVMVGILIFGIMGYKSLPVSDLPTVQSPGEELFHDCGCRFDELDQQSGTNPDHVTICLEPQRRCGGAGRPGDDRKDGTGSATQYADPAVL